MTGDDLYAWQVLEDSAWGTIAAVVPDPYPGGGPVPAVVLVTRSVAVAYTWADIAAAHRRATGHPVRLARFTLTDVLTVDTDAD